MRKSSWIILGTCIVLAALLGFVYLNSQAPHETLTREEATRMVENMQEAVAHKNVNGILAYVSPEPGTKIANLNQDQLRVLIARAFRDSSKLRADVSNIDFQGGTGDATMAFDLNVTHVLPGAQADDYKGRITLHLKRVDVSHLLGLYQTKEWRIVGAETTGPDPSNFGDF